MMHDSFLGAAKLPSNASYWHEKAADEAGLGFSGCYRQQGYEKRRRILLN
jgi:hypothetical protein